MPTNPDSIPLLSIIVAAYNAQAFIEACLASIADQMDGTHELLVIDDGSRDRTAEIACAVRDARPACAIRVISQPNGGVARARNRGLSAARGRYIQFVDADDLLLPGALKDIGALIAAHAPDVVACDFRTWQPHRHGRTRAVELGYPAGTPCGDRDAILRAFFADRHMYVWAYVIRREVYARQPQPVFPPGRVFEDVSVLPCLLAGCATLVRLARPIIDYRQHCASLTKAVSARWCLDFVAALAQVKQSLGARAASATVRMHIDVAACHFYIGIVKQSYLLPILEGRRVRRQLKQAFLASLFHHPAQVLAAMEGHAVLSRDPARDACVARQVRRALAHSISFGIAKAASRRFRLWQQRAA